MSATAETLERQDSSLRAIKDHQRLRHTGQFRTNALLRQIETACNLILQQLDDEDAALTFPLRRRATPRSASQDGTSYSASKGVVLSFPGGTAEDAWRFTVVLRLLHIIYEALATGMVITKRDIYYRDPALFGTQTVVDRYVEDLALTFSVPRARLNVSAAAKGLLRGPLRLHMRDGSILDTSACQDGTLVPDVEGIVSADLSDVSWILVIEKEATFRSIISSLSPGNVLTKGLIVTAKGYPDVATRLLLRYLCELTQTNASMLKLYAMVDFDPDGLSIYSNYKYGSSQKTVEELALPSMQFLGISLEHINLSKHDGEPDKSMLTLTTRDRTRATNMLLHDSAAQEDRLRVDLQRMLLLNIKVELQYLGSRIIDICEHAVGT